MGGLPGVTTEASRRRRAGSSGAPKKTAAVRTPPCDAATFSKRLRAAASPSGLPKAFAAVCGSPLRQQDPPDQVVQIDLPKPA